AIESQTSPAGHLGDPRWEQKRGVVDALAVATQEVAERTAQVIWIRRGDNEAPGWNQDFRRGGEQSLWIAEVLDQLAANDQVERAFAGVVPGDVTPSDVVTLFPQQSRPGV